MKHSTNYNLNKPDYVDQYDLRHWNENTDIIDNQMKSEETSRIQSDATLQQNIASEASARQGADATLQGNINNEVNARTNADTQIRNDIGDGTIVAKKAQQDGDGSIIKDTYQKKSNKVISWSSPTSNDNYPSEKLVKDSLDGKSNTGHGHEINDISGLQSVLNSKADVNDIQAIPIKSISCYFKSVYPDIAQSSIQLPEMQVGELKYVNIRFDVAVGNDKGVQLPNNGTYFVFKCSQFLQNNMNFDSLGCYYDSPTGSKIEISNTVPGGKWILQSNSSSSAGIACFILRVS